jgi:hypothetical protein
MEVKLLLCGDRQQPIDLWRDLLLSLDIDERAIGAWTIDRRFARGWSVRRLFPYGKRSTSRAVAAIRAALDYPDAEILEIEDLTGRGSLYVGVALNAIATTVVRR